MTRLLSRHFTTLSVLALSAIIVVQSLPALGQDATDATDPWQMVIMANDGGYTGGIATMPRPYSTKDACLTAARHFAHPERNETFRYKRAIYCSSVRTGQTETFVAE